MGYATNVGNAGEHLVMAELLARGFHAFMADRANPAFDISVYKDRKHSVVRVKTTTSASLQWNAKSDDTIFLEMARKNDFVAIVVLKSGVRAADIYIVPTVVADRTLRRCHEHWHKYGRRDGRPRKVTSHRQIRLDGKDSETNIGAGFSRKWAEYRDAWHLLK